MHGLKIPNFLDFCNLSGLHDAIGLSQQIRACLVFKCLKLFQINMYLSSMFSVTASVFGEALMPGLLLVVC